MTGGSPSRRTVRCIGRRPRSRFFKVHRSAHGHRRCRNWPARREGFAMRLFRLLVVSVLATAGPPAGTAGDGTDKPAEPPKELSFVAYDSTTRGALEVRAVSEKTDE